MSFESKSQSPLDYKSISYPGSMAEFRGPEVDLAQRQIVCIGGTETFGRFIAHPFSQVLAAGIGRPVANLGAMNAGLELILNDAAINTALETADHVVLQVTGAHLMTNRFYRVHPRRNDRFLRASSALSTVYRATDFTEFHFVRHMLSVLAEESADRFAIVVRELQDAWVARMRSFINRIDAPVHLLWMALHPPSEARPDLEQGTDPLFVTKSMLAEIVETADTLTICDATDDERAQPSYGMQFSPREIAAAKVLPGPSQHDRAASMLAEIVGS
ncbi:MAG: DUF6473 family protein [Pseudomonadota bacterium]